MNTKTSPPGARRGLLKRCLAFVGGGLGVGLLGKEARAETKPAAGGTQQLTMRLSGRSWQLYGTDHKTGRAPRTGERLTTFGELVDHASGESTGEFHAAILATASPFDHGQVATGSMEMHTFKLEDGTLIGMGTTAAGNESFAVVGGTGRYAGASGAYTAQQRPYDLGGDGSAEFDFTLVLPGETHGS
jgi:hypothetical protein